MIINQLLIFSLIIAILKKKQPVYSFRISEKSMLFSEIVFVVYLSMYFFVKKG